MSIVHLTTGLPASGKTTHARTLDAFRFNLDDYRKMLWGTTEWTHEKEHVAVSALIAGVRAAVELGLDCVIDNTHLTPGLPKTYRKELSSLGVTFKVHDFTDVDIEECKRRDDERTDGYVGEIVIDRLAHNHEKARKNGWRLTDKWMNQAEYVMPKLYVPEPGDFLPPAVIVDIDGTVAIHGGERGHYDYDKISTDKPNSSVIGLVQGIQKDVEIIFLSGREDRCLTETEEWLDRYVGVAHHLFMRKTGDHRPDYIIKQELFDANIRDDYNVLYVLDDRDQVIRMWRQMGLTALQVAYGDF